MKKMFSLMLLVITSVFCFTSCSNEEDVYIPQEVEFTLDYTFIESGSMTRATGADVYNEFYEKYIKTKQLTPTTYSLTFKNKETGAIATINGYWDKKDAIRLIEGEYEVIGMSSPKISVKGSPSDTVSISFNETIYITKDMSNLTLTAIYDSYLLLFDANNCTKCRFFHDNNTNSQPRIDKTLNNTGDVLNLFIKDFNYTTSTFKPLIELTRPDGRMSTIYLNDIPFEKGKYYYFNDMTNSFDIPKMESGN